MMSELELLTTYLWYGYVPNSEKPEWLYEIACSEGEKTKHEYNVDGAIACLDNNFDASCEAVSGPPVVPLSGGWDSRLILAALLDRYEAREITTITFGQPGQLDYDLGRYISKKIGTKHVEVHTGHIVPTWDELVKCAALNPWGGPIDSYYNGLSLDLAQTEKAVLWSGYIGDVINGGHAVKFKNISKNEEFIRAFTEQQKVSKGNTLFETGYSTQHHLGLNGGSDAEFLNPEIEYIRLRMLKYISGINFSGEMQGWGLLQTSKKHTALQVATPFVTNLWARYWLNAPYSDRAHQKLFIQMFRKKYPYLYSLPSKDRFGCAENQPFRSAAVRAKIGLLSRAAKRYPKLSFMRNKALDNYLDYNDAFRRSSKWKAHLRTSAEVIQEAGYLPWIDMNKMISDHGSYRVDYSRDLALLVGLAINLQKTSRLRYI